ncbi:hypothetical protein I4U23_015705 [Adineta vaga]|nr:hypothetical protein I4U23_015705 [Adineta vaga]
MPILYEKYIGFTLDDILCNEIRQNLTLNNQSIRVKTSAAVTMIMFISGLINSFLSILIFRNRDLRTIGCGIYLLASSVTWLITMGMFMVKFWFLLFTHIDFSIHISILRGGYNSIEPLLKLCFYFDGWLNAYVAIERAIIVFKSFLILSSIIHEPLYRNIVEIKSDRYTTEIYPWCITHYSRFLQNYNTLVLFFHLTGPLIANLLSDLFIIFGSAQQKTKTQTKQSYQKYFYHYLV